MIPSAYFLSGRAVHRALTSQPLIEIELGSSSQVRSLAERSIRDAIASLDTPQQWDEKKNHQHPCGGRSRAPVGNSRTLAAGPNRVDRQPMARSHVLCGANIHRGQMVGNQSCGRGIDVRALRIGISRF